MEVFYHCTKNEENSYVILIDRIEELTCIKLCDLSRMQKEQGLVEEAVLLLAHYVRFCL